MPSVVRRQTVPHVFDDGVRAGNFDIFFSAACSAGRTHILIGVTARANDRRVADASREFEG